VCATKQILQPFGDESICEADAIDTLSMAKIASARINILTARGSDGAAIVTVSARPASCPDPFYLACHPNRRT
jgi:hypothetical protein